MKVAYFSCLSPLKSGISDYSEKEVLPYLSKYIDIDIYIDKGYKPSNKSITDRFNIFHSKDIENRISQYDALLYHMGNNPFHIYIYEILLKYKGIVVFHDVFLHGLVWNMSIGKGNKKRYTDEFKYCYGDKGQTIAENAIRSGSYPEFEYPLLKRMLDNSLGVIVHSEFAKNIVLKEKRNMIVKKINMPLTVPTQIIEKNEVREKLGIDKNAILIATFGYIFPHKRIRVVISAFAQFHKYFPSSKYYLIGEKSCNYSELDLLIEKLGIKNSVIYTGFQPFERAVEYIIASDICVNLRYPTAGETSASVLRLMSMGKPVIVSNVGWFSELPDNCCAKVDVDNYEEKVLLEYLRALASNEKLREKMGKSAREFVLNEQNPKKIACEYYNFINEILCEQKRSIIKEVAYEMADIGITETDDNIIKEISAIIKDFKLIDS